MKVCPGCGHENRGEAKFCEECATRLVVASAAREQRKTLTVVFCDVTGSTALGASTDAEAVRALLARFFERMKGIVESHGGTVEKFIGDAVMAVFGVPQVHEDDALRAVRAACEMRAALPGLGIQARIGVNTGEVVTGMQERLATGDALNVAARLEQAAQPGEILIGTETFALVRDAVEVEAVEPLQLKGKEELVSAFRLVMVHEAPERGHQTPFVGRVGELETLRHAWTLVCEEQRCRLLTVVGDAGVGKSRLAAEFLSTVDARRVGGRCLPYGEGITYWPVVEVIQQLDCLPSDPAAAASIRSLVRETGAGTSAEEIAWAFRNLLEEQAPLVCLFDDIQWGEETFLDLIEHVALLSTGVPIMILCLARPGLAERRAEWPVALGLEPLPDSDVDALIPASVTGDMRVRIASASGGNPLFVTEMVAVAEATEGELAVPPTLQALLAARLDQLESEERSVLERGAVEGEVFHRGSIQALSDSPRVTPHLASLVRKGLIRPDKPQLPAEDAFRFCHLMLRDAAYDALAKATRAELHVRFGAWLEQKGADVVGLDEIIGYHLEQSRRYLSELGPLDDHGHGIGEQGSRRLSSAGRRAFARGDVPAAAVLLGRAAALLPTDHPERIPLLPEHGEALLMLGHFDEATGVLHEAMRYGDRAPAAAARASLVRLLVSLRTGDDGWQPDTVEHEISATIAVFESAGDEAGLAMAWRLLAWAAGAACQFRDAAEASSRAVEHARRAGDVRQERRAAAVYAASTSLGPTLVDEAIDRCESAIETLGGDRQSEGIVLSVLATLYAMQGEFDHGRFLAARGRALFEELGLEMEKARLGMEAAGIERLSGDLEGAVRELRSSYDALDAVGEKYLLSTVAGFLAQTLLEQGALDEASVFCDRSRELTSDADVATQALWRYVRGRILVRQGAPAEAEAVIREAIALLDSTDAIVYQIEAHIALGESLAGARRVAEARDAYDTARSLAQQKGGVVILRGVLRRLEDLEVAPPAT